jgi:phenylalanyl-tRNA synthetase beta chain
VALTVGDAVPAGEVEAVLREAAGELLESVWLFDVYRGEQVGEGHRSLAYRMYFRAPDRTLTTEEVNALRDRAIARAAERLGAAQRGA